MTDVNDLSRFIRRRTNQLAAGPEETRFDGRRVRAKLNVRVINKRGIAVCPRPQRRSPSVGLQSSESCKRVDHATNEFAHNSYYYRVNWINTVLRVSKTRISNFIGYPKIRNTRFEKDYFFDIFTITFAVFFLRNIYAIDVLFVWSAFGVQSYNRPVIVTELTRNFRTSYTRFSR